MRILLTKSSEKQKGDMLLEALISMLLMAIVAMGITFALSRVAVNQRDTKVHILVVNELRDKLLTMSRDDLCDDGFDEKITLDGSPTEIEVLNCDADDIVIGIIKADGSGYDDTDATIKAPLVLKVGDYVVGGKEPVPEIEDDGV